MESEAFAQPRVQYPNRGGLAHPASTQINEGTISPSARGDSSNSFGLPVTPIGPNVRAGDVSRSDLNHIRAAQSGGGANAGSNSKGNLLRTDVPQVNPDLPSAPIGPHVRAGDISRSDLNQGRGTGNQRLTNPGLPAAPIGPHMRAGDIDRSDLHPHRFDSNQKFWNRGKPSANNRRVALPEAPQPPTATYKNDPATTPERF